MKSKYAAMMLLTAALSVSCAGTASVFAAPPSMEQGGAPNGGMDNDDMGGAPADIPDGSAGNNDMAGAPNDSMGNNGMGGAPNDSMGNNDMGGAPNDSMGSNDMSSAPDDTMNSSGMGTAPDNTMNSSGMGTAPDNIKNNRGMGSAPNRGMGMGRNNKKANGEMVRVTGVSGSSITIEKRNMEDRSQKPDEQSSGDAAAQENEKDANAENTVTYDLGKAEILRESSGKTETASISDITEDSMLDIVLNEDGSVKTVTIREKPADDGKNGAKGFGHKRGGQKMQTRDSLNSQTQAQDDPEPQTQAQDDPEPQTQAQTQTERNA